MLTWICNRLTGELTPLVGVEYVPRASSNAATQKLVSTCWRASRHTHVPAVPVHDGHQVQEALRHGDVGDVRGPTRVELHSLQQIGKDPVSRAGLLVLGRR